MLAVADAAALPLPADSVDCLVTSPPYNVGIDYGPGIFDLYDLREYAQLVGRWTREMYRVMVPGGRVWIVVAHEANIRGSDHRRWSPAHVWHKALERAELSYRDTFVWHKNVASAETAWGSLGSAARSPNYPNSRGRWEPILSFYKHSWRRGRKQTSEYLAALETGDLLELARNHWTISPLGRGQKTHNWHPAPFPDEIPRRCIMLTCWPGDTVLDPFVGSGQTMRAAAALGGLNAIGFDLQPDYIARLQTEGLNGGTLPGMNEAQSPTRIRRPRQLRMA